MKNIFFKWLYFTYLFYCHRYYCARCTKRASSEMKRTGSNRNFDQVDDGLISPKSKGKFKISASSVSPHDLVHQAARVGVSEGGEQKVDALVDEGRRLFHVGVYVGHRVVVAAQAWPGPGGLKGAGGIAWKGCTWVSDMTTLATQRLRAAAVTPWRMVLTCQGGFSSGIITMIWLFLFPVCHDWYIDLLA